MASIQLSKEAPASGQVSFSLGDASTFSLEGKETLETKDTSLIANANAHPWLTVEVPQVEPYTSEAASRIEPADDPLTQEGQVVDPNDPAEARKAEEAKDKVVDGTVAPVAEPKVVETVAPPAKPVPVIVNDNNDKGND